MRMSLKQRNKGSPKKRKQTKESQTLQTLMAKKPFINIENKNSFNLPIPISSFNTIQSQSNFPPDSLPALIDLIYIEGSKVTETKNESQSQIIVDESNSAMLNLSKDLTIIPPNSTDEKDSIHLSNTDYRLIAKMAHRDWLEFLNYITVTITETFVSYEHHSKTHTVITERDKRYEMLFRLIKIFTISNIGEDKIDISTLSLKKVMKMMNMEPTQMMSMIKLIIVDFKTLITNQAFTTKRNILFNRSALLMSVMQEAESAFVTNFDRNKEAEKIERMDLKQLETSRSLADAMLKDLNDKVAKQKNKISQLVSNEDQSLVYCKSDTNDMDVLLRLKLLKAIHDEDNEYYDRYHVVDHFSKEGVYIKKSDIDMSKYTNELIEVIDERSNKPILIDKKELKEKYDAFTYYNQECVVVNQNLKEKGDYTIKMIIKESAVDKSQLVISPNQPEQTLLLSQKTSILNKDLNDNAMTNELIDLGNGSIVMKDLMTKLKQCKDNLDSYTVNNTYHKDSPKIKVSKAEIEKDNYDTLIEISNAKNQSTAVIPKSSLVNSIANWNSLFKRFDIKDSKGTSMLIDLFYITILNHACGDIPIQLAAINTRLKAELNPDYYYLSGKDVSGNTIYIRKAYLDKIASLPKALSKYYINDYNKKTVVISPSAIQQNVNYIEISNTEDKDNHPQLIPLTDIDKALNDEDNDSFDTVDTQEKPIQLKKTTMTIVKQGPVELGEQPEKVKEDLLNQITDEYIEVKDIEDNTNHLMRMQKLNQVINHKQTVPFETYVIEDNANQLVHVNKALCNEKIQSKTELHYIQSKDSSDNNKEYYLNSNRLRSIDCGLDDDIEFDHYSQQQPNSKATLKLKNIKITKLSKASPLPKQPEEEFMKRVYAKLDEANKIVQGREFIQVTDTSSRTILMLKYYLNLIELDKIGDRDIEIIDCHSNKLILNKSFNPNKSIQYFKIKNEDDNSIRFTVKESLITKLKAMKKQSDATLNLMDYHTNSEFSLSELNYSIMTEDISALPFQMIEPKPIEVLLPVIVPVVVNEEKEERPQASNEEEGKGVSQEEAVNIIHQEEVKLIDNDDEEIISPPKPLKATKPPVKEIYNLRRVIVKKIRKVKH